MGETVVGETTTQTRFIYDGNQIVLQFDGTGTGALPASDLTHRYLWGPAVNQLLADEQVTNSDLLLWALTDNENTVRDLVTYTTDTPGTTTVVDHRVYSSFGEITSQIDPTTVDCIFGYTGRPLDGATGLQNNLNRWYDASVGRWLSQDPIGFGGRDANLYGYCDNAPTDATDPSGTAEWDPTAVKGLLNKTEAGKAVSPGLQSSIVMQSPKVEAYYQERAKATDPWPNSWTPYEWGAMTTKKAITKTTIQTTLHIPASHVSQQESSVSEKESSVSKPRQVTMCRASDRRRAVLAPILVLVALFQSCRYSQEGVKKEDVEIEGLVSFSPKSTISAPNGAGRFVVLPNDRLAVIPCARRGAHYFVDLIDIKTNEVNSLDVGEERYPVSLAMFRDGSTLVVGTNAVRNALVKGVATLQAWNLKTRLPPKEAEACRRSALWSTDRAG